MTRPDGGPSGYPNPLNFDYGAAQDAIDALNSMIQVMQTKTTQRVTQGNDALSLWQGPHADTFKTRFKAAQDDAATLIGQCQVAVSNIQMMVGIARSEQHKQLVSSPNYRPARGAF
jgi:hypothetical protein